MRRSAISLLCVATLAGVSAFASSATALSVGSGARSARSTHANWREFRFSAAHLGVNPNETILNTSNVSTLQKAWSRNLMGLVEGTPAVVRGVVYVPSGAGTLNAIDASSGSVIWKRDGGEYGWESPAVAHGLVVVGGGEVVSAFDASTGSPVWTAPIQRFTSGQPTIDGTFVYVGDCNGIMYGIDLLTGVEAWSTPALDNCIGTSAAVGDGRVFVGTFNMSGGYVYALDAATGQVAWKTPVTDGVDGSAPALAHGVVYVGAFDQNLYALDAATGHVLWKAPTGGLIRSSPAVHNGVVYVGSDDGYLYAFDVANGMLDWRQHIGGFIDESSPAIANGVIYIAAGGGRRSHFEALDESTGAVLFRKRVATGDMRVASPIVVDGKVFIGSEDDRLYVFGLP